MEELAIEMAHVPPRFDGSGLILPDLPASAELPEPRTLNPMPLLGPRAPKSAHQQFLELSMHHGASSTSVDGPVALIRFSQNPSGSRRFLVSRSGHVYVARGLQVTGMVAGSVSNFIQRLLA